MRRPATYGHSSQPERCGTRPGSPAKGLRPGHRDRPAPGKMRLPQTADRRGWRLSARSGQAAPEWIICPLGAAFPPDHSRRRPVERAWAMLRLAESYASEGVVAVGMSGDEAYPGDPFAEVLIAARAAGLHVVHHAGEAAGPASIRQAITAGGAERLGHGIRVLDDDELVARVSAPGSRSRSARTPTCCWALWPRSPTIATPPAGRRAARHG
ncbi:MAG: hypothetical protein ACRDOK_16380 [Streptosporangiaceae bacterium]